MSTNLLERFIAPVTKAVAGLVVALLVGLPAHAGDKLPEVDSDGLQLVKGSKVRIAYVRPGATLSQYRRVMLLDCYVEFVEDWQRDYNMDQLGLSGRVSDKDAERIKKDLAAEFRKVFTDELTKKGYPVVEEPAPDVLLLRPALLNVDVTAPDILSASRTRTFVDSAGSMTLYMELYDATTETLLARVVDPQADDPAWAQRADRVTNKAAADRILRDWAQLLTRRLGEVSEAAGK
jgi:hypothetical protein